MSKKIWIAGVLTLVLALVAACSVAAAPVADPQDSGSDPQAQGQSGPGKQGDPRRGGFAKVDGEVTEIGDDQFTLQINDDVEVVVLVSASTNFYGALDDLSDLSVGDQVSVAGGHSGEGGPASDEEAPRQRSLDAYFVALSDDLSDAARAGGEVVAITSSSLTIETRDGETLEFSVNGETAFISRGESLQSLDEVAAGDHVQLIYIEASNGNLTAVLIAVGGGPDGAPKGQERGGPQGGDPAQQGAPTGNQQGINL